MSIRVASHLPPVVTSTLGAQGYCDSVSEKAVSDCDNGAKGFWRVTTIGDNTLEHCAAYCLQHCPRCAFVSFSASLKDCSWYATCNRGVQTSIISEKYGYRTRQVRQEAQAPTKKSTDDEFIPRGQWHGEDHAIEYGKHFRPDPTRAAQTNHWPRTHELIAKLQEQSTLHPERDIYQFGVYTGGSLKLIARSAPAYRRIWGFDSFQGLPEEAPGLKVEGKHWSAGAYSTADTLKVYNRTELMARILSYVGQPANERVRLIPGFYSDSLPRLDRSAFRPALLVDVDVDLYLSAIQCLRWLFAQRLIRVGTLVRYDDWGGGNETWGEAKAHAEITQEFGVRWHDVGHQRTGWREFQVAGFDGDSDAPSAV